MSRICVVRLLPIVVLVLGASALSASTITYAVGNCRPGLASFPTISAALAAVPSADVVIVCPGTYREQIQITQPVTLEGVSSADSAGAIIAVPAGGLVTNATDDAGGPVAAQLWVKNASGPVNISDLTVDGSRNGVTDGLIFVAGIFYQGSSGTVNRVATRNQTGNRGGIGIWAEGGPSNPLVQIENNSIHDYDSAGITVDTPQITAMIKENEVTSKDSSLGIVIPDNSDSTVTNNLVVCAVPGSFSVPDSTGIFASSARGSISGNTVANCHLGIEVEAGAPVTSNKVFGGGLGGGIQTASPAAVIRGNTITNATVGIAFFCTADPNVQSNIIIDAGTGVGEVPSAIATSNTYINVGVIRTPGC